MGAKEGANRRASVDEIVGNLLDGEMNISQVQSSLMRNYQNLDNQSYAERDALKSILASNIILSKAVGVLLQEVRDLKAKID